MAGHAAPGTLRIKPESLAAQLQLWGMPLPIICLDQIPFGLEISALMLKVVQLSINAETSTEAATASDLRCKLCTSMRFTPSNPGQASLSITAMRAMVCWASCVGAHQSTWNPPASKTLLQPRLFRHCRLPSIRGT